MNAVADVQAVEGQPIASVTENTILREMEIFERMMREILSSDPEAKKLLQSRLVTLRDLFYYRGYLSAPATQPFLWQNYKDVTLKKNQFDVVRTQNGHTQTINMMDVLLKMLGMRTVEGAFNPADMPSNFNRWMIDLRLLASGRPAKLLRAKTMGVPADVIPLQPKPKQLADAQPQPQLDAPSAGDTRSVIALPLALSPEDLKQEEIADRIEAALKEMGMDTDTDTIDFRNADWDALRAEYLRNNIKPLDLDFLDHNDKFSFEEHVATDSTAAPVNTDGVPSDMTELPSAPRVEAPQDETSAAIEEKNPDELDFDLEFELDINEEDLAAELAAEPVQQAAAIDNDVDADLDRVDAVAEEIRKIATPELDQEEAGPLPVPVVALPPRPAQPTALFERTEDPADVVDAHKFSARWAPPTGPYVANYSKIRPTTRTSAFLAAAGSFAVTAGLTMVSRYALVAAATSLGAAALPAGIAAGIAIGAARTYYKNRHEIIHQASFANSRTEKLKILAGGLRKCFSPVQIGTTIAASVAGAIGAEWVVDNADWLKEKADIIADHVAQTFTTVKDHVAVMYNELSQGLSSDAAVTAADVTAMEPKVVQTLRIAPDGTILGPTAAASAVIEPAPVVDTLEDRMTSDFAAVVHPDNEQILAQLKAQAQELTARATEQLEALHPVTVEPQIVPAAAVETIIVTPSEPQADTLMPVSDSAVVQPATAAENILPPADTTSAVVTGQDVQTAQPAALQTTTHEVKRGERSLWRIAQNIFGVKGEATRDAVEAIIAQNPDLASNPNVLPQGKELVVPLSLDGAPQADCDWDKINRGRSGACVIPTP